MKFLINKKMLPLGSIFAESKKALIFISAFAFLKFYDHSIAENLLKGKETTLEKFYNYFKKISIHSTHPPAGQRERAV